MNPNNDKVEEQEEVKEEGSLLKRMLAKIAEAKDMGATPDQLDKMRQYLYQETGWHPTKKRISKTKRQSKRNAQRKSRQINQRQQRTHQITKGYRKSGRV